MTNDSDRQIKEWPALTAIKFVCVAMLIFVHAHMALITESGVIMDPFGFYYKVTSGLMFLGLFLVILPILAGAVLRIDLDKDLIQGKLSKDYGFNLAWSVPKDHNVILAKITSWDPFEFKVSKMIDNVYAFWPVFSPGAKYVAMITGTEKGIGVANPFVTIYNTDTLESQKAFDLSNFSINSMALTDWGLNI